MCTFKLGGLGKLQVVIHPTAAQHSDKFIHIQEYSVKNHEKYIIFVKCIFFFLFKLNLILKIF